MPARRTSTGDTCRRLGAAVAGRRRPDVRVMDHVTPVTGSGDGERGLASERRRRLARGTVVIVVVVVVVVSRWRRCRLDGHARPRRTRHRADACAPAGHDVYRQTVRRQRSRGAVVVHPVGARAAAAAKPASCNYTGTLIN